MQEGGGNYSISNEGHIRSNIGKLKILKPNSQHCYPGIVRFRVSGVRKGFSVLSLMKKYWPGVILNRPINKIKNRDCEERKSLVLLLQEISY